MKGNNKNRIHRIPPWLMAVLLWTCLCSVTLVSFAAEYASFTNASGLKAEATNLNALETFDQATNVEGIHFTESSISAKVISEYTAESGSGCSYQAPTYSDDTKTLILTNTNTEKYILSFDYEVSASAGSGKVEYTFDEEKVTLTTGSKSFALDASKSITFTITASQGDASNTTTYTTLRLSNIKMEPDQSVIVTLPIPTEGAYSAKTDAAEVSMALDNTESGSISVLPSTGVQLSTTAPAGFVCLGWIDADPASATYKQLISGSSTFQYYPKAASTVMPVYMAWTDGEDAPFAIGSTLYYTWESAFAAAAQSGGTVVLNKTYSLPTEFAEYGIITPKYVSYTEVESTDNTTDETVTTAQINQYTIGIGQKLLIPYQENDPTGHFGQPEYMMASSSGVEYVKLTNATKKFRELIVPAGVTIECQGGSAINVDAIQRADDSASFPGCVGGFYGQITLMSDADDSAKIILESGARLHCYGFIVAQDHNGNINRETATGEVIAKSGSHVYEFLEISDWRGGSQASTASLLADAFLFSQYYVQNICSSYTIHSGATETLYFAMSYEGTKHVQTPAEFIGANSLFRLGSGSYMTRKYDAETDRMRFDIYGDLSLNSMTVTLAMGSISDRETTVDSSEKVFPLQSNYDIFVHSGTITLNQRFKMHPGCYVEIMEGAKLTLGNSGKLYIYSKDDFNELSILSGKRIKETPTATSWTYNSDNINSYKQEIGISTSQFVPGRGNGVYDLGRGVRTWEDTGDAQLVINGEMIVGGNIYTSSAGKGLSGTGKITVNSIASDTTFKEYVQANVTEGVLGLPDSTKCPVNASFYSVNGLLAGISAAKDDVQKLGTYTYYGTESDGWYNYLVKAKYTDGASAVNGVAVTAPADSTSHTVTRYVAATDTSAATTEEITDVVGYVTYDSAGAQNTFTFTTTPSNATVTTDQGTLSDSGSPYSLTGVQNDATLTLTLFDVEFTQIVLGNALDMRFAFAESNMANWAGAKVVVVKEYADGRDNVEKEYAFDKGEWVQTTINGNTYYYVTFDDISAKEMADSIHIVICDANGVRISNRKTETVRDYIVRVLNNGSQSDAAKTMLVDMLNYGAAAQTYYKYGSDNLANAELTTDQQSLGTQSTPEYEDKRKQGGNFNGTRLELKNSIDMHLVFSGLSDGMYATITHESHWGNQVATENVEYCTDEDGKTYFDVDQIVVADGRQLVTVTVYNSDGETVYGKVTDSVEGYVARTMGDSNASEELKELCLRILMFSDSAKTYLATT